MALGLRALRGGGYRWIVVAGHSRGAWIALTALAHADLADAVVAISPAAFGTRPERRAEAMAAWQALWESAQPACVVLVQLADDPYDSDPEFRLSAARARTGMSLLSIFQPLAPRGHVGAYEPEFDTLLGERIAAFVAPR